MALIIALDVVAWLAIQVGAGYLVHRLPIDRMPPLRLRRWEESTYRRVLRVRRWKASLPEAGAIFTGGYHKRRLGGTGTAALERYVAETRRAELGHWLALIPAPLFFLWNPPLLGVCQQLYGLAVNGPCVVSQRYNRIRLLRVLDARRARGAADRG